MSRAAGDRSRLISIEKLTGAVDGANPEIEAWLFVMKRWARILTATGMATVRSSQQGIPLVPGRYSFRINYTPTGINEGYRVNDHGVFYDIHPTSAMTMRIANTPILYASMAATDADGSKRSWTLRNGMLRMRRCVARSKNP